MTDIVDLAQDVNRLADFQNFVDDSFTRSFKEELSAVLMDKSEELHKALEASNFITLIKASSGVKFNDYVKNVVKQEARYMVRFFVSH